MCGCSACRGMNEGRENCLEGSRLRDCTMRGNVRVQHRGGMGGGREIVLVLDS